MIALDGLILMIGGLLLGGLFVAAGIGKLRDFGGFVATLRNYRLMPDALAPAAAAMLMAAELTVGSASLAAGVTGGKIGLGGAAALLALYSGAMASNLLRGRDHIDCGCLGFGARRGRIGWALVARNLLLALAALTLLILPDRPRALTMIDWVSATGGVIVFALLYHGANLFLALKPQARKGYPA